MVNRASNRALAGIGCCVVLGAFAASSGACGGLGGDDLFNSGGSGATSGGGMGSTTSTSTSGPGGTGGSGGGVTTSTSSATSTSSVSSSASSSVTSTGTGAMCGDGMKQSGEQCDGMDFGGLDCTTAGFTNPAGAACTAQCKIDYSGCKVTCDGQKLEPMEVCDGLFLNGKTCKDFAFSSPDGLKCSANCAFDTSGCKPTCDGQKLEPTEVCDGNFLNGKTCKDFGYVKTDGLKCKACAYDTSGCKSTCGNSTVEPGEQCDDGNTAAGDGCSPTCQNEASTCAAATPVTLAPGTMMFTGNTSGGGFHTGNGCASAGPDRIFAVKPTVAGFLTAAILRNGTDFNTSLYAAPSCSDAAPNGIILCEDSYDAMTGQPLDGGEVLSFRALANNTYYFFIDGVNNGDSGNFTVTFNLASGKDCSDPVPIPLEAGTPMTFYGINTGAGNDASGTCGGGPGDDVVYAITRGTDGPLSVSAPTMYTNYNSVLYLRTVCASTNPMNEPACSNLGGGAGEMVSVPNVTSGTPIFLYVDGSTIGGGNANGTYGIVVTP